MPVCISRANTWAAGMTAPVLSLAVPEILPLCAQARAENVTIRIKVNTTEKRRFVRIYPPNRAAADSGCRKEGSSYLRRMPCSAHGRIYTPSYEKLSRNDKFYLM